MKEALIKKTAIVKEISEKIKKSESLLILEYKSIKVKELESLRNVLREGDSELKIYKNNLVNLALKETEYKNLNSYLTGPNAIVFGYGDQLKPAKISAKFAKKYPLLKLKAGIYNQSILGTKEILEVALLPTREELIATFASLLHQPLIKFAIAVKEIIKSKNA